MTSGVVNPAIIVHGGAGQFEPDRHTAARLGCQSAANIGLAILSSGGSALDAVQAAVRMLEDDPTFNAGIGSVLARTGEVELDAAIMCGRLDGGEAGDGERAGRGPRAGAIAAMPNVRQPIDLARVVLEDGEHIVLCAEGAWAFARERGFAPCDPEILVTERARARLAREAERRASSPPTGENGGPGGTVGACAVDARGHVAAATSTGGINYKRPGRIGDTPLLGCGTYADDRGGAASATGHGESIIRALVTGRCVDRMRAGASPVAAARACADQLFDETGGTGGVICCDPRGRLGAAHNTPHMPIGVGRFSVEDGPITTALLEVPRGWVFE